MSRDVFISYKTEDKEAAERLCAALEHEQISCWMAPRDIPPGSEWAASIVEGLERSKSFVLLLSSHSVGAKQIAREAELADRQNIPIIAFRLEEVQPPKELLYFLGNIQWVEAFGGRFDSATALLAKVVRNSASYPAPETQFPKTRPATTIRESIPVLQPAAPQPAPAKSYRVPLGVGLAVVAAVAGWLGFKSSMDRSGASNAGSADKIVVDAMQQARAVSDRFLAERGAANYEAAWSEYTTSFHNRESHDAWQKSEKTKAQETGGVLNQKFNYCKSSEQNVYICEYTLRYKNGLVARNELWVVKDETGRWAIDKGTFKALSH